MQTFDFTSGLDNCVKFPQHSMLCLQQAMQPWKKFSIAYHIKSGGNQNITLSILILSSCSMYGFNGLSPITFSRVPNASAVASLTGPNVSSILYKIKLIISKPSHSFWNRNLLERINIMKTNWAILWIVIYPVDSAIHHSNKQGQQYTVKTLQSMTQWQCWDKW